MKMRDLERFYCINFEEKKGTKSHKIILIECLLKQKKLKNFLVFTRNFVCLI